MASWFLSDVTVRRAKPEDHEAIMGFGVIGERDYLPSIYMEMVSDPDIYPLVAEVKGQVVGFYMSHVIDGGISVIKRAARVHPKYRSRRLMHLLSDALDNHTTGLLPKARYSYINLSGETAKQVEREYVALGYREILRKPILTFDFNLSLVNPSETEKELPTVYPLGYDDVKTLFTLEDKVLELFPLKRIMNHYIAYRCLESNIKHFLGETKEVCVTTATYDAQRRLMTPSSWLSDVDVVTFTEWFKADAGFIYILNVYAKEGHNDLSLSAHLHRHLESMQRLNLCDTGLLVMSLGASLSEDRIRSHMKNFKIFTNFPGKRNMEVLFEKKM